LSAAVSVSMDLTKFLPVVFFFLIIRQPPRSTLFPYTTLFRSYEEDFSAEVDMNVVGNAAGELLEVQGTAEKRPFTPGQLAEMVALAQKGLAELHQKQLAAIAGAFAK